MQKQDTSKALAPHLEEIARVIRKKIDGKREGWGTANFVVRREVTRLANLAGTRRLVSHSATFRRALNELDGRELAYLSQRRAVVNTINTIARWLDLTHILPTPTKRAAPPARIKGVRRIKLNGNWLEKYGVEMNDRLLVAMTGEVRPGELGYFEAHEEYKYGKGTHLYHRSFFFLFERDKDCQQSDYVPRDGVCLRGANYRGECAGLHVGSREQPVLNDCFDHGILQSAYPFGRVVGVERAGKAIETTLPLRPYDEREGVTTTLDETPEQVRPYYPKGGAKNKGRKDEGRVAELKRRLEDLDDDTTSCTPRFQLEKQIYDLEHPIDLNDWSAWQE